MNVHIVLINSTGIPSACLSHTLCLCINDRDFFSDSLCKLQLRQVTSDRVMRESFIQPIRLKKTESFSNETSDFFIYESALNHSLNWFVHTHWFVQKQVTILLLEAIILGGATIWKKSKYCVYNVSYSILTYCVCTTESQVWIDT